jgi:pimeloyl-ACP methyl ester carboxylesterase
MLRKTVTLIAALVLVSCSQATSSELSTTSTYKEPSQVDKLDFRVCGQELPGLECAYAVLDKDRRTAEKEDITVRVGLLRSFSPDPVGAVFINPGGPGSSSVKFLSQASGAFAELRKTYDVYAVDPRGTGGTAPLNCNYDLSSLYGLDITPDDDSERALMLSEEVSYIASCQEAGEGVIGYITTADSASDMRDVLDSLGMKQMNYLGFSYGSELGAVFATLFPTRVGRFVFDGASDFRKSPIESSLEQGRGFEEALNGFLARCDTTNCLGPSAKATLQEAVGVVEAGLATYDEKTFNSGALYIGLASLLYIPGSDAAIAEGLAEILQGQATIIGDAFYSYLSRESNGSDDGSLDAFRAITTEDGVRLSIQDQETLLREAQTKLPFFWPVFSQPTVREDPWPKTGTPTKTQPSLPPGNVLYVAATGDPATTYKDTIKLASDMGAETLTRNGSGHTSYFFSECVRQEVHKFISKEAVTVRECETDD